MRRAESSPTCCATSSFTDEYLHHPPPPRARVSARALTGYPRTRDTAPPPPFRGWGEGLAGSQRRAAHAPPVFGGKVREGGERGLRERCASGLYGGGAGGGVRGDENEPADGALGRELDSGACPD
jgi:hypothetical protein